ncbi:hypothetical protein D3C81_1767590 [compost metagenome]
MPHACHEVHQPLLVGMGRIAADRVNTGADLEALVIEVDITALGAELLNHLAGCAACLIAHEQHVMAFVAEHGLQVVDDAAATAHAVAGYHDGGAGCSGQVADHAQVGVVVLYR